MNTFLYGLLKDAQAKASLTSAMGTVNTVLNTVIGALGGVVVLFAIYLAYKFITADTEDKRKNAKAQMIYAIIGVIVIFAVLILWNVALKPGLEQQTTT
jgi:uncharacterized membrane-anchored protein